MTDIQFIIILGIVSLYLLWLYYTTNKKLQQKLKEYENIQNEFNNLKTENISLQKDKISLEEKLENFQNLEKENQSLKNEINNKNIDITKIQTTLDEIKNQNQKLEKELKEKNSLLDKFQKENISQKEKIASLVEIEKQYILQKEELSKKEKELNVLKEENNELQKDKKYLETKLEESKKSYEEKMELLQKSEEKLKVSFENLANKILEETKDKMVNSSKVSLSTILNPLQNDIKDFKNKLENIEKDNAQTIGALQNELKNLKELNIKLSDEAHNLTKALKGDKKKQGNWGELVLERVLEMSGLTKGREYEREVSLKNSENKTYRPDVIVHLPDKRDIIIDAKTSLSAYDEYIKTEDKNFIDAHIKAIKTHIDTLANKRYENLEGVNSLDFVFMFIPIENALMLALENDTELFEYAFKKKVVLVSPTTLLVSLRAIESAWRFEKQTKNIEEIVKSAESLYDKVRGFTEDFEKIGKSLEVANTSFENAKKKLTTGRGNVIRQIELLKQKANIKPKKEIDKSLLEEL